MAQNYDLQNTGPEVQERLDQVMPNKDNLAQEVQDRQDGDANLQEQINTINAEIGEQGGGSETINGRLNELEAAVGDGGSVDERIDAAKEEILGGASEDYNTLGKVEGELEDTYRKEETYTKQQVNDLITTPDVQYVSVVATDQTTAVTDLLPATGADDTIYRIGNWDGTQYDATMYALYAWNGSAYVCLAVRSFVGEVYDISANHPDGQGNPTPYADLTAALAYVPVDIRAGGMSVKFIQGTAQSSDNKYVQFRLMAQSFTTDTIQWQGVDVTPTPGSRNLVESGGVFETMPETLLYATGVNLKDYNYSLAVGDKLFFHNNNESGITRVSIRLKVGSTTTIISTINISAGDDYIYTAESESNIIRVEKNTGTEINMSIINGTILKDFVTGEDRVIEGSTTNTIGYIIRKGQSVAFINDGDNYVEVVLKDNSNTTIATIGNIYADETKYYTATQDSTVLRINRVGGAFRLIVSKNQASQYNTKKINRIKADASKVIDVSVYNSVDGNPTEYAGPQPAINSVPLDRHEGGLTVKFIYASTHKYLQYFLPEDEWTNDLSKWVNMNVETVPINNSGKLVTSGGVYGFVTDDGSRNVSLTRDVDGGRNSIFFDKPIKKGSIINFEYASEDEREFNVSATYNGTSSANIIIARLSSSDFKNAVITVIAPVDISSIFISHSATGTITSAYNYTFKMTVKESVDGILGMAEINKNIMFLLRNAASSNVVYGLYRNIDNAYGGTHKIKYYLTGEDVNIQTINGKIGFDCASSIPLYDKGNNAYIVFTNPNNINCSVAFTTEEYYNSKYPRIPYSIATLGYGRSVISPVTSKYCHNSFIALDKTFTYGVYHSNAKSYAEHPSIHYNNVYLSILEDGRREVLTKAIFSDLEYVEQYNEDGTDYDLLVPYNHSIIDKGDDVLIRCGFLYDKVTENTRPHIWMYKVFNKATWELSAIAPQKLMYEGLENAVDWTHANYLTMLNTLYGYSFDPSLPDSYITTVDIIKMTKYGDKYYLIACSNVKNGYEGNVPYVLMSSDDAITWSPIAKVLDNQPHAEESISILNDKIYMVFRPVGQSYMKYAIFGIDGTLIKAPTEIEITHVRLTMPETFVYNNTVYAFVNKAFPFFNKVSPPPTGSPFNGGRQCIALCYFDSNDNLVELKQYVSAAGLNYYGVAIRGYLVRFINIEDNGGDTLPPVGGAPDCQCSICDINNEDLVIPEPSPEVPEIIEVTDISSLTGDQLDVLHCGDLVVKVSGDQRHTYWVSYKDEINGELSLTYADHENVEEVYYEKSGGVWGYVQTDNTPISS